MLNTFVRSGIVLVKGANPLEEILCPPLLK